MLAADLVGAPEAAQATTVHRLIVTIANNRQAAWQLADPELVRVLFEIGRRAVAEKINTGTLALEVRVPVHTDSHPAICPFAPSLIQEPDGAVFEIDQERRIGFR